MVSARQQKARRISARAGNSINSNAPEGGPVLRERVVIRGRIAVAIGGGAHETNVPGGPRPSSGRDVVARGEIAISQSAPTIVSAFAKSVGGRECNLR